MTARDLMNLMIGYPDYEITSFIWDYDFMTIVVMIWVIQSHCTSVL